MDKLAIEAFLYSADFGEDNYMLASSSSSESEPECCCSDSSDNSIEKLKLKRPKVEGFAEITVPHLIDSDFKNHFRVSRATCEKVTELLYNDFYSDHKGGWERITPTKAAYIVLWYLGNRETFKQIAERFRITQSCVYNIVKVGCRNLSSKLNEFIKWPKPKNYEDESLAFYDISKIGGIIGAISVSHLKILKPKDDHEKYRNLKNYHSIAVQGTVGSNNKFIDLYISEGSLEPTDILRKSSLPLKAEDDSFGNYVLVGNNSYPSLRWLITPFQSKNGLSDKQKQFNQHHNWAYNIVNQAFGLLKERFQRLNHLENKDTPLIIKCIQAACIIHNICIDYDDLYEEFVADEGIFEYEVEPEAEICDGGKKEEIFNMFLKNCDNEDMVFSTEKVQVDFYDV